MVSFIANTVRTPVRLVQTVWDGLGGIAGLIRVGMQAARSEAGFKSGVAAALGQPENQRRIFSVLRVAAPNIALKRIVVQSYENTGTAVVCRHEDVLDVLHRDADFGVVYGPRMRKLTDGDNFFLGMQPGWDYTRDTSAMHLAARRTDVADFVAPRAASLATRLVSESNGALDLPTGLTLQVPWDMTASYFGVGGPDAAAMQEWTTTLFWYLFGDLGADPTLEAKAMAQAAMLRDYLDQAIAARKAAPTDASDILNRCLALQSSDTPGMSDLGIRNNLLGLLIGAIPTISKASCLALDELLNRPEELAKVQQAARSGDDDRLAGAIWEALRFNPHNPVIYRRAMRDAVIAPGTLRQMKVKQGQMVFAATYSAMFDRFGIDDPQSFNVQRALDRQIIWGTGMHTCFGAAINAAVIPAILKPVLQQANLRRAPGETGQIDTGGTPFPQHFTVHFDPR